MTFTSTPITVKDANSADKPLVAYSNGAASAFAHPLLDSAGAIINPATVENQSITNSSLAAIEALLAALDVVANIAQVGGATLTLGQKAMTASVPVVLASDQGGVAVVTAASTSGGVSTFSANGASGGNALLTNSLVAVKTSAGSLYGFDFVNTGNAAAYVQIFDAAPGSVTLGTTPPKLSKWVPPGGSWEEKFAGEGRINFSTAITIAATSTATGNGAPNAPLLANVNYK